MNKVKIFNLIILDESGSMNSIKSAIISGFNELVQSIKASSVEYPEQKHYISLVSFNSSGIKTIHDVEDVEKLREIDKDKYRPNYGTPLYDAIGFAVNRLRTTVDTHEDAKVLVTILTDGMENSSTEYTARSIRQMIEELQKGNWTFTYIGANHDVIKAADDIAVKNHMSFEAHESGVKDLFVKERMARSAYFSKVRRGENEKENYYTE